MILNNFPRITLDLFYYIKLSHFLEKLVGLRQKTTVNEYEKLSTKII